MTKQMFGAQEVADVTGMSTAYAFKLIRRLNGELEDKGVLTIPGKVDAAYFGKRVFGGSDALAGVLDVG